MTTIPLASKSDPAKREVVTSEELINLYAVKAPEGARCPFYLNRTPGMTVWSLPSPDLCRGLFNADSEGLGVYGSTLFTFNEDGGPVSKGTISGDGDIRWSQNNATNRETLIVTGSTVYQYTNGTLSTVSDADLPSTGIVDTICINGISICFHSDGRAFYSPVNDANNYDALDFFTVPGTGDLKAAMLVGNRFVVWRDAAFYVYAHVADDADEPFQLVQGADKPFGCLNTFANANVGGVICFVDQYGSPRVLGQGYAPQPIGNEGVQADIAALENKDDVRLWGYVSGDRGFLVVHSSDFTWVYDFKEQRWHNRQSYGHINWQAKHYMRFANKDLVAPDHGGDLFYLDDTSFEENGEHLVWEFTTPPITNFPNGGTVHALHFDIEVGTALDASAAAADQEPKFTVYLSRDAKTYGTGRQLSLGTRGKWRKRLSLTRCGDFGREGFIIRASGSGRTPNAIMNLDAEITERAA